MRTSTRTLHFQTATSAEDSVAKPATNSEEQMITPGAVAESVSKSTMGTIGEMLVSADLLKRGYYVFSSATPNSPFDLAAYHKDARDILRIEVTCGRRLLNGELRYDQHDENAGHFTHVAVVLKDEIEYVPALPEAQEKTPATE